MIQNAIRYMTHSSGGWLMRWRRLVCDYEQRIDVSEAMMHAAMGSMLLRKITH